MATIQDLITTVFGGHADSMDVIEARAREAFPTRKLIVWRGDPQTFQFNHVSGDAEELLGYPPDRWIDEPTFWADHVVHDEDRDDAIAFCALATGRRVDHAFEYRARSVDGRVVWLHDFVRVDLSPRGIPSVLRGLMIDITADKQSGRAQELDFPAQWPPRSDLVGA